MGNHIELMVDDQTLEEWFCKEVLPLERSLTLFIRRNWRVADEVDDLRNDIYALVIGGARKGLPTMARNFVFVVARNHLINCARRSRIVSFELVADMEAVEQHMGFSEIEQHLNARETLRRVQAGLDKLPPRVREIIWLRKVEGLDVQETCKLLGISKDAVNHQVMMGMKALANHLLGGSGRIVRRKYGRRAKSLERGGES